jgi:hypothetical protein
MSVTDDAAALKEIAAALSRDGHAATQNVTAVAADHLMVVRGILGHDPIGDEFAMCVNQIGTSMGHIDNLIDVMAQILEAVANRLLRGGTP